MAGKVLRTGKAHAELTDGNLSTVAIVKPEAQGERKKWAKSLPLPSIARPPLAQCSFMDAFALLPGSQTALSGGKRGVTVSYNRNRVDAIELSPLCKGDR